MAEEVHELVVKLSPEGAKETREEIDQTSDSFTSAVDNVEGQSEELEAFAERWKGAFTVIAAGLAVGVTALLSQVPVLSEILTGLQAIAMSLALTMDQFLRPALTPLSNAMFDVASAIDQLPDPLRDLLGLITTGVSTVILFAASWAILETLFAGTAVASIAKTIAASMNALSLSILGVEASTLLLAGGILLLTVGLGLLASELLGVTNHIEQLQPVTNEWMKALLDLAFLVAGPVAGLVIAGLQLITGDFEGAKETIITLLDETFNAVMRWGHRLMAFLKILGDATVKVWETIGKLWRNVVKKWLNFIISLVEDTINALAEKATVLPGVEEAPTVSLEGLKFETKSFGDILQNQVDRFMKNVDKTLQGMRRNVGKFAVGEGPQAFQWAFGDVKPGSTVTHTGETAEEIGKAVKKEQQALMKELGITSDELERLRKQLQRQQQQQKQGTQKSGEKQDRPSNRFAEESTLNIELSPNQMKKLINTTLDKGVSNRGR